MTKQTLFELNDNLRQLKELILNTTGDETEDEVSANLLDKLFNQCEGDIKTKVDNYIYLIRDLEAEQAGYLVQSEILESKIVEPVKNKAKKIEKQIERLKNTLRTVAKDNNNLLKGDIFTVKIQKGAFSAKITDEKQIPDTLKAWQLKIEYKQELLNVINKIFDKFGMPIQLTATGFLRELISELGIKPTIDKKSLINELRKATEGNTIKGAFLEQSESMRIN